MTEKNIQSRTTEYKIGNTTYTITTTFSPDFKQSLSDIIRRMIIRDSDEMLGETEQTINKQLTPEIMHELIDKIVVHAPDKSNGHRTQEVEIHFRFKVATAITMADSKDYDKKRKVA